MRLMKYNILLNQYNRCRGCVYRDLDMMHVRPIQKARENYHPCLNTKRSLKKQSVERLYSNRFAIER